MFIISTNEPVILVYVGWGLIKLFKATNGVNFGCDIVASVINLVALKTKNDTTSFALTKTGTCTRGDNTLFFAVITLIHVIHPTMELAYRDLTIYNQCVSSIYLCLVIGHSYLDLGLYISLVLILVRDTQDASFLLSLSNSGGCLLLRHYLYGYMSS